jgi:hypothetical protein
VRGNFDPDEHANGFGGDIGAHIRFDGGRVHG